VQDTATFFSTPSSATARTRIIGPNCPGLISPGKSNAGIIPADITGKPAGSGWSASPAR
jgi:succinyl-CoA synthetase alpha subunit